MPTATTSSAQSGAQQQWVTPLASELQRVGVASPDIAVLEAEWINSDPATFVLGLDWVARCYMEQRTPKLKMPRDAPWGEIASAIAAVPPGDIENTIALTIAQYQSATQAALFQAIMARSDMIQAEQARQTTRKRSALSAEYLETLERFGYSFRQNELNDIIEVNGHPISDNEAALMRRQMHDAGFEYMHVMEDTYTSEAFLRKFNPVRDYFAGLAWDGQPHIASMAQYFVDKDQAFPLFVRRWLIGAVAKALSGAQNRMLVLNGAQGIGKGWWCKWLCKGLGSHYYVESAINPDDKDAMIRLASKFIWEVSELGATTRRADVESLKNFLTLEQITIRRPYGKYDMIKPALASFIGTINDQKGFLTDPTGTRRFMTVSLLSIEWNYYTALDPNQIWAEAHAAYLAGEAWNLQPDEVKLAEKINETYEVEEPVEGMLKKYFFVDPTNRNNWTPTIDILLSLEANGLKGQTQAHAKSLGSVMTKLGIERVKRTNSHGQRVWAYLGVTPV